MTLRARCVRLPLVLALASLVATSCFRSEIRIDVDDDGSGTVHVQNTVDSEALASLSESLAEQLDQDAPPQSREELCSGFTADQDIPAGTEIEPYDDGDFCGHRYSLDFTSGGLAAVLDDETIVLERDGDGWRFEAPLGEDASAGADLFPPGTLDDAEFLVRVRLPGRQVEHNADRIESDGTMVWDIEVLNPPDLLFVRTVPGEPITGSSSGGTSPLIWVGIAMVIAAGAALFFLIRRTSGVDQQPSAERDHDPT